MKSTLWFYSQPFPPHLCCYWLIKILPNQPIQNTIFFDYSISHPPYLLSTLSTRFIILLIYFFLSLPFKTFLLPSILENSKGGCHMPLNTCKPHVHQPIQLHGQKRTCLWRQVDIAYPCKHLVPSKTNPNICLSLFNPSCRPSPLPTNLVQYLILKPLQNPPNSILIKNT